MKYQGLFLPGPLSPRCSIYIYTSFLLLGSFCVYIYIPSQNVFFNAHEHFSSWIKILPNNSKHYIYHLTIPRFQTQNESTLVSY